MAEKFFTLEAPDERETLYQALDAQNDVGKLDAFGSSIAAGIRTNMAAMGIDKLASSVLPAFDPSLGRMMDPEEANEIFPSHKEYTEPISFIDAAIRSSRERFLLDQQYKMEESGLNGGLGFLGNIAGGFVDPVSLLGGSALGKLRTLGAESLINQGIAVKLARGLQSSSTAGILMTEALENAAFTAAFEIPLVELGGLGEIYGEEFGVKEHAFNIAVGTAAGTLFRHIGRAFNKNADLDGSKVDQELGGKLAADAVADSLGTGKAPDFHGKLVQYKGSLFENFSDPVQISKSYQIVGEFDRNTGVFFSSHKTNLGDVSDIDSQVVLGSSFGQGLYLTSNPALAMAKTYHLPEGEIVKLDVSKMKLLDAEQSYGLDEKFMGKLTTMLRDKLPKADLEDIMQSGSLKTMLKKIDALPDEIRQDVQDAANGIMKQEGFDGFSYREDFFDDAAGFELENREVGRAVFLFPDVKTQSDITGRILTDNSDAAAKINPNKQLNDDVTAPTSKQIEMDRKSTKLWERDYKNDNPMYSGEVWRSAYIESFDASGRADMEFKPEQIVRQVEELADEVTTDADATSKTSSEELIEALDSDIISMMQKLSAMQEEKLGLDRVLVALDSVKARVAKLRNKVDNLSNLGTKAIHRQDVAGSVGSVTRSVNKLLKELDEARVPEEVKVELTSLTRKMADDYLNRDFNNIVAEEMMRLRSAELAETVTNGMKELSELNKAFKAAISCVKKST